MKTINAGFSLIELMIVIAIIGILSSIAIPSYQTYVLKAKFAELISAGSAAQLAVADYILSTGSNDCTDMPIVLQGDSNNITGGKYPYPAGSAYVSEVDIGTDCNIWVSGKDGAFGNRTGLDIAASFVATIDNTGIVFNCKVQNEFAPNTCTRTAL